MQSLLQAGAGSMQWQESAYDIYHHFFRLNDLLASLLIRNLFESLHGRKLRLTNFLLPAIEQLWPFELGIENKLACPHELNQQVSNILLRNCSHRIIPPILLQVQIQILCKKNLYLSLEPRSRPSQPH